LHGWFSTWPFRHCRMLMGLSPGGQEFYGDINGLEPF
jgi:hypothetical protein